MNTIRKANMWQPYRISALLSYELMRLKLLLLLLLKPSWYATGWIHRNAFVYIWIVRNAHTTKIYSIYLPCIYMCGSPHITSGRLEYRNKQNGDALNVNEAIQRRQPDTNTNITDWVYERVCFSLLNFQRHTEIDRIWEKITDFAVNISKCISISLAELNVETREWYEIENGWKHILHFLMGLK